MDTHQEIYDFILAHPLPFSEWRDVNAAVNYFHQNQERWQRQKAFIVKSEKTSSPSSNRTIKESGENSRIAEAIRRMRAMHNAGASVQEIAETVPNWIDDGPWDEYSVKVQLGLERPRWQAAAEQLVRRMNGKAS